MEQHWIVVGAGSAGCVIARRLSEDPHRSVTLLDDGPDLLPGQVPAAISGPSFFEAMAVPGRIHDDLIARRNPHAEPSLYQRGRGVGGSSAVNAMVALRGDSEIYRRWDWDDADLAWDRVAIPSSVAADDEVGAVNQALLDAEPAARLAPLSRRDRQRVTSAEAYLWPALDRPNLAVRAESAVDVVLAEDSHDSGSVTGVRLADGTELVADHVVVCAGAIHSPTILLRSGITTPGIGQRLQDHPAVVFTLLLKPEIAQDQRALPIAALAELPVEGDFGRDLIQLLPMNSLGPDPDVARLGALMVALMTPTGNSGTVTVGSDGAPVIDFKLLDDERDVLALTAGVEQAIEILGRRPFADLVDEIFIDDVGTTIAALDSPESISDWLRSAGADYVHATSTCAMGTVVDQDFRVNGYRNLFVCDASVFPTIPDVNTHFPTTMLAERFAFSRDTDPPGEPAAPEATNTQFG